MPTIVTRGVASARGAGTFSAAPPPPPTPPPPGPTPPPPPPPPVAQTVSFDFPGTYSWTAPSGVTSITNLIIAGGRYQETPAQYIYQSDALNPVYSILTGEFLPNPPPSGTSIGFYRYSDARAYSDNVLGSANAGGTGDRVVSYGTLFLYRTTSLVPPEYWLTGQSATVRIRGRAEITSGPWDNQSSENANGLNVGWYIGAEVYYPPASSNGTPSSAFGFSVPGGTANNPDPIGSFGSVSVTPGQTYVIVVGGLASGVLLPEFFGGVVFQFNQG